MLTLRAAVFRQTSVIEFKVLIFESARRVEGSFWRKTSDHRSCSGCGFPAVWSSNWQPIDPADFVGSGSELDLQRKEPQTLTKKGGTDSSCYPVVQVLVDTKQV